MRDHRGAILYLATLVLVVVLLVIFVDAPWDTKLRAAGVTLGVGSLAFVADRLRRRRSTGPSLLKRIEARAVDTLPAVDRVDRERPLLAVARGGPAAGWVFLVMVATGDEWALVPLDGPRGKGAPSGAEVQNWSELRDEVRSGRLGVLPQSKFSDMAARQLSS